ncbi:hypothetical protein KTI87_14060 [Acinetobacter nosocomialis]|uniref:hypothetical protein n=1 Tax=Acinetobacter nosocomialis TaxID=106654 RepID=UPI0021D2F2BF|nr:hypothetical protein [Acinetobacter nosocomialis]MCU4553763.1 hypothetical protein [Acinetobacter nosocomialis]
MLFSEKEIEDLKFCSDIARYLNKYDYKDVTSKKGIQKLYSLHNKFDFLEFLRNIILGIDGVVNHIANKDELGNLRKYFSNFLNSNININKNFEYRLDLFALDLYEFVTNLFEVKQLFNNEKYEEFVNEINLIRNQLLEFIDLYSSQPKNNIENRLYDRVVLLEENLKKLSNEVKLNSKKINETAEGLILTHEENFKNKLNDIIDGLRSSLSNIHTKYENEVKTKVESLDNLVNQTDDDFKSTFNDYNQLKGLVNIKGEMLITDHYKKRAFWERITYWAMTVVTFIIIIISICLALNGLKEYKEKTDLPVTTLIEKYKDQPIEKIEKIYSAAQTNALIYLVLRLIFSVLLFSSIIYTSRVAYRAYVHMRHSENMMLKLATLRPFINQLEEEDRNQIHKDLIPDYFGKDAGMVDSTNEKFKDLPANVSAVAMKAIEQISGSGSNSNTGKNDKKPESETG